MTWSCPAKKFSRQVFSLLWYRSGSLKSVLAVLSVSVSLFFSVVLQAGVSFDSLPGRLDAPSPRFQNLQRGLFLDVTKAGARVVAVGRQGVILYSDDQGKTWSQAKVPVSVMLTAVHFTNDQLGWAVGHSGVVLHSYDGGASWQRQLDGWQIDQKVLAYAEANLKRVQSLPLADSSQLQDVPEGEVAGPDGTGETSGYPDFLDINAQSGDDELYNAEVMLFDAKTDATVGADKPLLDVMFLDGQHGFVVGAYGLMLETLDSGRTWDYIGGRTGNLNRYHLNALARVGDEDIWVVGEAGSLFRSADRGKNWKSLEGVYEGSYFGVQGLGDGAVLVYGLRGHAFISEDQGVSWQVLETGIDNGLMASIEVGTDVVFMFGYGGSALKWQRDSGQVQIKVSRSLTAYHGAVMLEGNRMLVVGDHGINELVWD